ncbi:MAG: hypothetical protein ACI4MM_01740 [Candidatus Ventricola sp.]
MEIPSVSRSSELDLILSRLLELCNRSAADDLSGNMTILFFRFFPAQKIFIDFVLRPMYHMSVRSAAKTARFLKFPKRSSLKKRRKIYAEF